MENKTPLWKKIPRWINGFRLVILNIIFFGLLLFLIIAGAVQTIPEIPENGILVINPMGRLVNRYSDAEWVRTWRQSGGTPAQESLLTDVLYALDRAGRDERIEAVYLSLDGLSRSGMAMIDPLAEEILRIKESGKPVYGFSSYITQEHLYLLSLCDYWAVDPFVSLEPLGYSSSRLYFARAMERWGFNAHIYKAGDFKSFTEVYSEEGLTDESRDELQRWLDNLWEQYVHGLSSNLEDRTKNELNIENLIVGLPGLLEDNRGSWAELLIAQGIADVSMTYYQFQNFLNDSISDGGFPFEIDGISSKSILTAGEGADYQISYQDYILQIKPENQGTQGRIAFIPLSGEIYYGEGDWGSIGSESVIRVLDNLYYSDYQGLVLWLDSPGGSAIASEEIRRALERVKERGIKVSLVMGNSCASGGYWISTAADHLVASPYTITGSIGVFSYSFSAEDWLEQQWGILEDGYSTTAQAQGYSLSSPPSEDFKQMQQSQVNYIYSQFLTFTANARELNMDEVEELAQGRIWTGAEAVTRDLVDQSGFIHEAFDWHADQLSISSDELEIVALQEDYLVNQSGLINMLVRSGAAHYFEGFLDDSLTRLTLVKEPGFNDPQNMTAWTLQGASFLP